MTTQKSILINQIAPARFGDKQPLRSNDEVLGTVRHLVNNALGFAVVVGQIIDVWAPDLGLDRAHATGRYPTKEVVDGFQTWISALNAKLTSEPPRMFNQTDIVDLKRSLNLASGILEQYTDILEDKPVREFFHLYKPADVVAACSPQPVALSSSADTTTLYRIDMLRAIVVVARMQETGRPLALTAQGAELFVVAGKKKERIGTVSSWEAIDG